MNLDPRSIPYRIFENGLQIVGIIVLSVLFTAGGNGDGGSQLVELVGFVVLGLVAVVGWQVAYVRRFEYTITPDTFDIRSGVLSRREREIPFERIQNVDIAQNIFQRAIGIAEVRIETAGGGDSEARLRYVSRGEATRLQELISDRKREGTERDPGGEHDILFELDTDELAILGVTSANFRFFGAILVGLTLLGSGAAQQAEMTAPRMQILLLLGPLVALGGLVVLWVVSGVQAVLRYYGFRLLRHENELRYERGLLQRYNGTIPLSKIQTVMIRENLFARLAGYATLVVETAGYAPGQGSDSVQSAVPIAKRARVIELANTIENVGHPTFERPPKRARTRYVFRYTFVVAAITAAFGLYHLHTGAVPDWYLAAVLWVFVPPAAHLKWSHLGYHTDDEHVITRSGFWTRRTTIVPYYRVQVVADNQTIFQARRDLGTLVVDTATSGGLWGGSAIAYDIDIEDARRLREDVHERFHGSIERRKGRLDQHGDPVTDGGRTVCSEDGPTVCSEDGPTVCSEDGPTVSSHGDGQVSAGPSTTSSQSG